MASPKEKMLQSILPTCGCDRGATRNPEEKILSRCSGGRHEFIARDFRGNAHSAVVSGLDAHNLPEAADIYIAGLRNLLRQSDDEFKFVADFEIGIRQEIQSAITDVPRVGIHFMAFFLAR